MVKFHQVNLVFSVDNLLGWTRLAVGLNLKSIATLSLGLVCVVLLVRYLWC